MLHLVLNPKSALDTRPSFHQFMHCTDQGLKYSKGCHSFDSLVSMETVKGQPDDDFQTCKTDEERHKYINCMCIEPSCVFHYYLNEEQPRRRMIFFFSRIIIIVLE